MRDIRKTAARETIFPLAFSHLTLLEWWTEINKVLHRHKCNQDYRLLSALPCWFEPAVINRPAKRLLTQIGAKKGRGKDARMVSRSIYFFGPFSIYYIPHNNVIPQAMPHAIAQIHFVFYPHRFKSYFLVEVILFIFLSGFHLFVFHSLNKVLNVVSQFLFFSFGICEAKFVQFNKLVTMI